jgi:hypothetical protein
MKTKVEKKLRWGVLRNAPLEGNHENDHVLCTPCLLSLVCAKTLLSEHLELLGARMQQRKQQLPPEGFQRLFKALEGHEGREAVIDQNFTTSRTVCKKSSRPIGLTI